MEGVQRRIFVRFHEKCENDRILKMYENLGNF